MKILISIGGTAILLPDDSGVSTVLKVLSKGVRVYDRLYAEKLEFAGTVDVEIKTVPPGTRLIGKPTEKKAERLALPEPGAILL